MMSLTCLPEERASDECWLDVFLEGSASDECWLDVFLEGSLAGSLDPTMREGYEVEEGVPDVAKVTPRVLSNSPAMV